MPVTCLRCAAFALGVLPYLCALPAAQAAPAPLLSDFSHTAWGPQHGAPNDVVQFAQTPDGWLWLASPNGLYRFDGVRFERMDSVQGQRLHSTNVLGLLATPDGTLWIGHRFGGVSQVKDGHLHLHMPGEGLPAGTVFGIVRGPDGAIWVGTANGLGYLAPGARRFVAVGADAGLPQVRIYQILFARNGRQWIAAKGGMYYREPGQRRFRRAWP
jgi:ligand-binding sensor domain-containing protein